jgi:hypothetical protein
MIAITLAAGLRDLHFVAEHEDGRFEIITWTHSGQESPPSITRLTAPRPRSRSYRNGNCGVNAVCDSVFQHTGWAPGRSAIIGIFSHDR